MIVLQMDVIVKRLKGVYFAKHIKQSLNKEKILQRIMEDQF